MIMKQIVIDILHCKDKNTKNFEINNPRKGTARGNHSAAGKQVGRTLDIYVDRSKTHACGNWD